MALGGKVFTLIFMPRDSHNKKFNPTDNPSPAINTHGFSKPNPVTIEDIKSDPRYRDLSEDEQQKILDTIRTLARIIYQIACKTGKIIIPQNL